MQVGTVARRTGLSADAIRFYERSALLATDENRRYVHERLGRKGQRWVRKCTRHEALALFGVQDSQNVFTRSAVRRADRCAWRGTPESSKRREQPPRAK